MCGIFGWALPQRLAPSRDTLSALTNLLAHRGPDSAGTWVNPAPRDWQVAFGHRRLSIIDLSDAGSQPMIAGDCVLSLNGEIYNYIELREELKALGHSFRSQSDTEVVLKACIQWGEKAATRFRGMFALSFWDARQQQLILMRDAFGKKPLFIGQRDGGIIFGSEIAPLAASGLLDLQLDWDSVHEYLLRRYVPGPNSFYDAIKKLPPGHIAVWRNGTLRMERYYLPPYAADTPQAIAPEESVPRFLEALDESVKLRMRSDAAFGVFLSGGLDSSAIVALMARHSSGPVKTFSVGFHEKGYSELAFARKIAERYRTEHHELIVDGRTIVDRMPDAIRHRGAPLAEAADIPILELSESARGVVKMVLTGEGSDELLAGYPKHHAEPWIPVYQSLMPDTLHRLLAAAAGATPVFGRRLRNLFRAAGTHNTILRKSVWFAAMTPRLQGALFVHTRLHREIDQLPFSSTSKSALRRLLFFDQTSWLPDNLLERADRMMMAAGIEGRMPFMDTHLTDVVAGLDEKIACGGRGGKWILREAMKPFLPEEVLYRAKIGFRVPVGEWFLTSMRDYVRDMLTSPSSITSAFLNAKVVARMLREHEDRPGTHESAIWALINLEQFLRVSPVSVR